MNFFPFHIGDYAKRTKHLSLMEDLAYRRMLELYYTSEGPLPIEPEKIARLIGMRDQIKDVCEVLSDFFVKSEKGWVNNRCEEEISVYTEKANRARKANKARWNAKSDLIPDVKSDLISDADQIPTNPNPNPNPKKKYIDKKRGKGVKAKTTTKTPWPDTFILTDELEAYAHKNGVSSPTEEFENFRLKALAHGYCYCDWGKAWMAWCRSPLQKTAPHNGNGTHVNPTGCVMRIQLEEFRFGNCGKPSAGEIRGKILCKEHLNEAMVKA